jgi:Fe-S-cluster containining protein
LTCKPCQMTVAISFQDCRRIAKHKGLTLKRFLKEYTLPHELDSKVVENARMIRKVENEPCPFYDSNLPGCSIQSVKPQVCSAALYLTKMNLILCRENHNFSTFPNCPEDIDLRSRIKDFAIRLEENQEMKEMLKRLLDSSSSSQVDLFRHLLRLKGLEIYFGKDTALPLAQKLGLKRLPNDEELKSLAFLYAATLLKI